MAIKTIVAFLEPSRAGFDRANYAVELAYKFGAHLIGAYVAPSGWGVDPAEAYVRGRLAIRRIIERHKAREDDLSSAARRMFASLVERKWIGFEFRIVREADAGDLPLHLKYSDLVIASEHELPGFWTPEAMLRKTGIPVLILPDRWNATGRMDRIVMAWNASQEARRAISDALPLLSLARIVHIVVVDARSGDPHGEEPGADAATFLARHGVDAVVERLESGSSSVAETLRRFAEQAKADLMVIGAYSHSRTREMIFGGVTRSMLKSVRTPLLIAR